MDSGVQALAFVQSMEPHQLQHALEAHYAGVFDTATFSLADAAAACKSVGKKAKQQATALDNINRETVRIHIP